MDLSRFSEGAQAELNKVIGKEPAPEPTTEVSADTEVEDLEVETEVDSDTSIPDGDTDEAEIEVDDSEEGEPQTPADDIEYIKAGGKKVKVDFNDRENIKRVYAMAAGARQWQAERDSLKTTNTELEKKYGEIKETLDFLEDNRHDDEKIFELTTGKSLNETFKAWAEEQQMIVGMTESEKELYLSNQDHRQRIAEVEKRERQLQAKLENASKLEAEAAESKQTSIANPIFFKYNFDNELGDPQLEYNLNNMLWDATKKEMSQYDTVTPDMFEESFKRISNQVRSGFKNKAQDVVKKTVKNKQKAVKAKAQEMAVAAPKNSLKLDMEEKIKSGDIVGLMSSEFDSLLKNYQG